MSNNWEMIDDGSFNGVKKYIRAGMEEDSVDVRYEGWDVPIILDQNKSADPINKNSELWHVGHIPTTVGLKWLVEEGLDMWNPDHSDGLKKKLMCSDYRHLVPGMNRIMM